MGKFFLSKKKGAEDIGISGHPQQHCSPISTSNSPNHRSDPTKKTESPFKKDSSVCSCFVDKSCLILPSIFPRLRVISDESALCIRWPKYWSFGINHSGLISFKTDWFDLLAVKGTLKSLLQHHSLKASNLQSSVFFLVQLSHPYMTTGGEK